MIESIMIGMGFFALGALTSLILTSIAFSDTIVNKAVESGVFKYKLPNGNQIHMWKGFAFPDNTFVYATDNDGDLTGDGVVFDKNGSIIVIDKYDKTR